MLAHMMKGSGGGYGFKVLTDVGSSLENAAKAKRIDEIEKWVDKLRDYLERVEVIYE